MAAFAVLDLLNSVYYEINFRDAVCGKWRHLLSQMTMK